MRKLKLFFACMLMAVLSIGQVWATGPITINFGTTTGYWAAHSADGTNDTYTDSDSRVWTRTCAVSNRSGQAGYSQFGNASNACTSLEFSAPAGSDITVSAFSVTMTGASGGATPTTGTIYLYKRPTAGDDVQLATASVSGNTAVTCAITADANFSSTDKLVVAYEGTVKAIRVNSLSYTYTAAGGTPTCSTPTFSPEAGTFYGSQEITLATGTDGASIYYTTDGTTPSSTNGTLYEDPFEITATTTIKAIAVKKGANDSEVASATYTKGEAVSGYTVDFESDLAAYVDWEFTNLVKDNAITAHGGTYFVNTNAQGSASATTKEKVAKPGVITYYISKKGNNTNANSKWSVQVSTDGSNWTTVGAENNAGAGVTEGTWNECSADLSEYTDVYVRVYYKGTTAVRTLDDIELTMASAIVKPSISGETPFLNSTNVSISIPEGTTVYYTTDGSNPKTAGTQYSAAFDLNNSATVKAIATDGVNWSEVAEKAFTKATIMTVAQARAAIDAGGDLTNKFVAGIISQIDSYQSNYHSITYWISDDGTTTDQLEVYSGLAGVVKSAFASKDDLAVGDDVTVKGTLKKYNSTYEFDYNNTIEAYKPIARLAWSAESYDASLEGTNTFPTLTNTYSVDVTYSSSDAAKASFADASVYDITLNAVGSTTITASFAGNETYKANSVSYTLNVASSLVTLTYNVDGGEAIDPVNVNALPNPLPTTTKAGKNFGGWFTDPEKEVAAVPGAAISENTTLYAKWLDPYTVAEAKTVIDANPDGIANQYVTGIISQIDSYNSKYYSITYWISADGTTTDQLQVYSGLIGNAATALGKDDFSAKEDLELGDEVVVTGTLKLHNSTTYEFDKNNSIYTFSRKASAGLEYAETAIQKTVGDDVFTNPLTNPNSVTVTYSSSDEDVAVVDETTGEVLVGEEGTATITAAFAGDDTYKAAEVSYTVTVSAAAPVVDTRMVANSPATFTAVSGDLTPADITYASNKGGAGTAPAIYNSGIRLYQKGGSNTYGGYVTLTAVAGCTIDEVQITTTSTYSTTVAYSIDDNVTLEKEEEVAASGSYTTGTGLNTSSVNILNLGSGSNGRLEIASIKVYYTGEALTIDHYELGGTYATEFEVGDDFNHTGLIVYAAYDALGENKIDITSACTFSAPDMSAEGEKTIEITYKDAVVKSYTITVNASTDTRKVADSPATFDAVSGDLNPNEIKYAAKQGGAGNAPYLATGGIRLYQKSGNYDFGGFMTIKAAKGCTIDQVKITTSGTYATTVAYSVDGNENLLQTQAVAKSGSYTTPEGLNVESVNILNLGTGSSGRLEIASIKVWYTGEALPLDHYFLAGQYPTEFVVNTTFSYEGLEVYAAYDAQETIVEAVEGFTVVADLSNEGQTTASVRLNNAEIATYNITVVAQTKLDPALSYDPEEAVVAAEAIDAWTAPALSNTYSVAVSYSSSKEAVATVDAEGTIALAGGYGTAVITASFAGDDTYLPSEATYTITVNEPTDDLSGTWTRVTAVAVGQKIIIAGTYNSKTMTMGKQNSNNRAAVLSALEGDVLTPAEGTKVFTLVDAGEGLFAIQALNGKYLNAAGTGSSNYLREADDFEAASAKWTITFDENGANIVATSTDNRNVIRYNSTNNSELFSCYAAGGQRAIQIYSTTAAPEPPTPSEWVDERTGLQNGKYYTICLENNIAEFQGASFWYVRYKNAEPATLVYLEEVTTLEAGKPYIFQAEAETLQVKLGENIAPMPVENGALRGTFAGLDEDAFAALQGNIYILKDNAVRPRTQGNWLSAHRAYFDYEALDIYNPALSTAPGRRVRAIPMQQNGATGFENIEASEKPMKLMIDGKIYILRGEKMYDATGRLVK